MCSGCEESFTGDFCEPCNSGFLSWLVITAMFGGYMLVVCRRSEGSWVSVWCRDDGSPDLDPDPKAEPLLARLATRMSVC